MHDIYTGAVYLELHLGAKIKATSDLWNMSSTSTDDDPLKTFDPCPVLHNGATKTCIILFLVLGEVVRWFVDISKNSAVPN